ncbi:MAG: T9SS type A sorting domain-containing protein [Bacteroidetes bacterium]|nr:T9SS type A sorting domain-containing protein [Bacteroidota bacterium]
MKRTFTPPCSSPNLKSKAGQSYRPEQSNPPLITYADLDYAYSPQNGLQYYSQDVGTGSMNIGTVNLVTPQQWVMPPCTFNDIDTARGIPVSQTPYLQYFPTATHCKLYEYPEYGVIYSYFEYYKLNPTGITLLGSVDDFEITPNVIENNFFIAPLSIDINFHLVLNDTLIYGNQKKILNEVVDAEGFGTLTTPWGTIDVLKIVTYYNELYYEDGELVEEYHQPVITFISKTGNELNVTLPEGSATTGTVSTEMIEFTRIVYDSFATVQNVTLGSGTTNCYDAFGTITVAGNGTAFTANSGSSATMISGHNIKYQAGTKVKSGGLMHGYITANSQYCPINYTYITPENPNLVSGNGDAISRSDGGKNGKLQVFPNPTTGDVTIQIPENSETRLIKAEITDINGIIEISENLSEVRKYNLTVESLRPGMYFLHVTTAESIETIKLIRR